MNTNCRSQNVCHSVHMVVVLFLLHLALSWKAPKTCINKFCMPSPHGFTFTIITLHLIDPQVLPLFPSYGSWLDEWKKCVIRSQCYLWGKMREEVELRTVQCLTTVVCVVIDFGRKLTKWVTIEYFIYIFHSGSCSY